MLGISGANEVIFCVCVRLLLSIVQDDQEDDKVTIIGNPDASELYITMEDL